MLKCFQVRLSSVLLVGNIWKRTWTAESSYGRTKIIRLWLGMNHADMKKSVEWMKISFRIGVLEKGESKVERKVYKTSTV